MTKFPYEDSTRSADARAEDLLKRLSVRDKVGLMWQTIAIPVPIDQVNDFAPELGSLRSQIERGITHYNLHGSADDPKLMAERYNEMQKVAISTNARIPLSISSDPRHAFTHNPLSSMFAGCFSQWPEQLGLVALRDEKRMEEYGDIMRQEYLAVGLRGALHPQVDLATQPLWSRISGGMGEDADLASKLVAALIRGLQGAEFGTESVSACVKHFPGGGPQRDGLDCHMPWGKEQDYPGHNFDYHLKPFQAAFDAGVRWTMPSYGQPIGTEYEEVGMAFNKQILTDLLRNKMKFEGIVVSDWCILEGWPSSGDDALMPKHHGVEHLTLEEKIVKALDAGVDQFGGDTAIDALLSLVNSGKVSESRIDVSAFKLLREKFILGLFDNPFVDVEHAVKTIGKPEFMKAALKAQADALTLIINKPSSNDKPTLPLAHGSKVYVEGFEAFPEGFGSVVASPSDAEVIIVRLLAPWTSMGKGVNATAFHHGSLEFSAETLTHITELAKSAPVVIELYCDRPAVLGSLFDDASAIVCSFGISEPVLASVLFGASSPKGKLPFDLPRSDAAVKASRCDVAFDTKDPFFRCGFGLQYE